MSLHKGLMVLEAWVSYTKPEVYILLLWAHNTLAVGQIYMLRVPVDNDNDNMDSYDT